MLRLAIREGHILPAALYVFSFLITVFLSEGDGVFFGGEREHHVR